MLCNILKIVLRNSGFQNIPEIAIKEYLRLLCAADQLLILHKWLQKYTIGADMYITEIFKNIIRTRCSSIRFAICVGMEVYFYTEHVIVHI